MWKPLYFHNWFLLSEYSIQTMIYRGKNVRTKIISINVIIILILSTLILGWDFDIIAKNLDDETNNGSTSISGGHKRSGDIDWWTIEVISEPIPNQNNNEASYDPT